jgi:beta-lactam-binding protein with PASTA domain
MPDIIGMSLGQAEHQLGNQGIVFFDVANRGPLNSESEVIAQSPRPGAILHPPKVQVSLSTR